MNIWDVGQRPLTPTIEQSLFNAASRNNLDRVMVLLQSPELSPKALLTLINGLNCFHVSCKKGYLEMVKALLRYSTDNGLSIETSVSTDGRSGFLLACYEGKLEVVELLSQHLQTHQEELADHNGNTALHYACWGGHLSVIQFLLDSWSSEAVHRRNFEGMTPMQYASAGNHVRVVEFLSTLAASSDIVLAQVSDAGYNVLHKACQYGAIETIKLLCSQPQHVAQVNIPSKNGTTALHLATQHGFLQAVKMLVEEFAADCNAQTEHGLTPLHYCCLGGHSEIAAYLMNEANVETHRLSVTGAHALHLAAASGMVDTCRALVIEKGTDPFVPDRSRMTPIDAALSSGYKELASKIASWSCIQQRSRRLLQQVQNGPTKPPLKVLFCGMGHFESGFLLTRHALINDRDILVVQCPRSEVIKEIVDAAVVVPLMTPITAELVNASKALRLVSQFGVGLEGVDIEACTKRGIAVCKIPSDSCGNAQSCAEHAIFLALAVMRDHKGLVTSVLTGRLGYPTGMTLLGATALIIGYGGLGKQLASRLMSFGMAGIYAVKRTALTDEETENDPLQGIVKVTTLTALEQCGYSEGPRSAGVIFVCCTLNSSNREFINGRFLSLFPPGIVLVNIARGGLIHYPELLQALNSGQVRGCGLDVYHTEPFPSLEEDKLGLLSHPRVVATPHVAGVTERSYQSMANIIASNIKQLKEGRDPIDGQVNKF